MAARPSNGRRDGRMKLVMVGTGMRGITTWGRSVLERYGDMVEFVGLCDVNTSRAAFARDYMGVGCPVHSDHGFDDMLRDTRPDRVIVTTVDCFHAKYICRALELGFDVITEKPMATDERMVADILAAERRTGRDVTVTFNLRYSPFAVRIKEVLASGEIGRVSSVDFTYYVDIHHGGSYFRRWHGYKRNNGSLFVTKSCHHFDLVNWWLDADPVDVMARGRLVRYGHNGPYRGERCRTCPHAGECVLYWDVTTSEMDMRLYVDAEEEDGYLRDACLYRGDLDVWDAMAAQVGYANDVILSYTLNCFMPYEGFRVGINGDRGRLDARVYMRQPWDVDHIADFRVTTLKEGSKSSVLTGDGGGHLGADDRMKDMIFRGSGDDPLGRMAGSRGGAMASLTGIAARRSVELRRPVTIAELAVL